MRFLEPIKTGSIDRRRVRERRKAERTSARDAAVSVVHGAGVNTAVCGDVSRNGARLSLDRPLNVGERLTVILGPDLKLTGRVAWVDGANCGIEFDEIVDAPEGLPAKWNGPTGTAVAVSSKARFRDGLRVTVMLPDCEKKAVLRWTQDNCASLSLHS